MSKLTGDPTMRFQKELQLIVNEAMTESLIESKLSDYLVTDCPVKPLIYILPKIHKDYLNPPGRPIVSEHEKGLAAVDVVLSGSDVGPGRARLVLQLLEFILRRNYFLFGDDYYLQLRGTAMGSNVAPTHANIYMAVLEDQYVYASRFWPLVRAWWRYIDDIFVVWEGQIGELLEFHHELNSIYPELDFTVVYSRERVQFLDTMGLLYKLIFFAKSTDRNSLLQFNSHHPKKMVQSLPWSQMLRVRKIITDDSLLDIRLEEMCNKFLDRGYPYASVEEQKNRARATLRSDVRKKNVKVREKHIPFVSTYNTASGFMRNIILKHWHILQQGLPRIDEFTRPPLLSYKRGYNLKDKLVKSDVGPTSKKIFIKGRYTCTSSFVIYLITCPCGLTYVGETTMQIKACISKHKSTIRTKMMDLPIPKHFIESCHAISQLRFRVIDNVPPLRRGSDMVKLLKQKELGWISKLGSRHPGGLNVDYNLQLCAR
ncbi:unnamed protein product [Ranitomeya imitator]|uniref:Reverse transcriptase domain-containing protein n=1 Tax=Ranitomeya imitator TaxID=111125 RepID=A0ABN9LIB6_9NEOB|nr:unnamed protein product [Ranitomeya imitator]